MMQIYKTFVFDSAHWLPHVPDGHKCRNMHGHTYQLTLFVKGSIKEHEGWVMDFGDLKSVVGPIIKQVDHHVLNEINGLENPTCEIFCSWWYDQLKPLIPGLYRIKLQETPSSGAIYTPITGK